MYTIKECSKLFYNYPILFLRRYFVFSPCDGVHILFDFLLFVVRWFNHMSVSERQDPTEFVSCDVTRSSVWRHADVVGDSESRRRCCSEGVACDHPTTKLSGNWSNQVARPSFSQPADRRARDRRPSSARRRLRGGPGTRHATRVAIADCYWRNESNPIQGCRLLPILRQRAGSPCS